MATFNNIALEEASTVTHRMATVTIDRGGTNEEQEVLVIGDPESSLGLAGVLDTAPASTQHGLVVRIADPIISSVAGRVIVGSTAAEALVTVYQSTASELLTEAVPRTSSGLELTTNTTPGSTAEGVIVRLTPSTIDVVSSIAGRVYVGSTAAEQLVTVYQSTASELLGEFVPRTSSGLELTTNAEPASTAEGVVVRLAPTTLAVSSVAGQVSAMPITSSGLELTTNTTPASTAEGLIVRLAPSTIDAVSTGNIGVSSISTGSIQVSAFAAGLLSSGDPVIGQQAQLVEPNVINCTYASGVISSADSTIVAAISTSAFCVYAISWSENTPASNVFRLVAASTNEKFRMYFNSSVVSAGFTQAVTPPQYLFKTAANQSISIENIEGAHDSGFYSISYYEEG